MMVCKMGRKLLLGCLLAVLVAGCAAPQPTQPQPVTLAATLTRARAARPSPTKPPTDTPTPEAAATATAVASPTDAATPTVQATATPQSSPAPTVRVVTSGGASSPAAPAVPSGGSGVLLPLNPNKYAAPALLTPPDNALYHVSQPVVHFAWTATPTDLMTFGQTPGCVSDATNFRRALESYQLIIHSLDAKRADQVQWTEGNPTFDLNLTTVPAGRYSWSVNIITVCESYVVAERNNFAQHKSTLQRSYVAAVSPMSATRIVNWVP